MRDFVYVIGAGASKEFGLPTGEELKQRISTILLRENFDDDNFVIPTIFQEYLKRNKKNPQRDLNELLKKAEKMSSALILVPSIDNYIYNHQDDEDIAAIGKIAISKIIMDSERKSILYSKGSYKLDWNKLEKSWLVPFFRLLTEQCKKDELEERFKQVAFIIFNYDRCIEEFLIKALCISYNIKIEEAAKYIENILFIHPYGFLGYLPWQNKENSHPFGMKYSTDELLEISSNINTFTEGTNPEFSEIDTIKELLVKPKKLVFLGFAYHHINMDLLNVKQENKNRYQSRCLGTSLGISDSETELVRYLVKSTTGNRSLPVLSSLTCFTFMKHHSFGLSFLT